MADLSLAFISGFLSPSLAATVISLDNLEKICVQCQAGQHKKCLFKSKEQPECDCEHCLIYG